MLHWLTAGESHGRALVAICEGMPAGVEVTTADIAGPVPLAVDGARLAALADGRPVPRPHQDPDVLGAVAAAVAGQPAIAGFRVADGDPAAASASAGEGGDLQIELTLAAGCSLAAGDEAARLLGRALMEQLGGRLRRGFTITVARPGDHTGP